MKTQINALTATRAFAAIMVIIFHFGTDIYPFDQLPQLFKQGNNAVSYFFVLSGFVMFYSYYQSDIVYWDFFKKRIARIAPVYWFALLLMMLVRVYAYHCSHTPENTREAIYSALFVQAYATKYMLTMNTAGWTICSEMLFYVLFPFLLLFAKKRHNSFIIVAITVYVATQMCILLFFPTNWPPTPLDRWMLLQYHPLVHMNEFLVGMTAGIIFRNINTSHKAFKYILSPVLWLAIILILVIYRPAAIHYEAGMLAPVFAILITGVAIYNPRFLRWRPLVFLGDISYSLYILQHPVKYYIYYLNEQFKIISDPLALFITFLLIMIGVSAITFYVIEVPFRRRIASLSFGVRKLK